MRQVRILWDDDDNADGNVQHIALHGLTKEDVEHVLQYPSSTDVSRSTGLPCVFGHTPSGEYTIVVYEEVEPALIYPITAYQVPEPRKGQRR